MSAYDSTPESANPDGDREALAATGSPGAEPATEPAIGEGDPAQRDAGTPSENDVVRKDMSYSPGSETETQRKQENPLPDAVADDVDGADVRVVPGTGGPDDVGDVDVDPDDIHIPGREG